MSGRFFTEIFRPQQGKRQQIRQTIQRVGPKFPHRPQQLGKGAEKQHRAAQSPQHQESPQLAVSPPQQKQEGCGPHDQAVNAVQPSGEPGTAEPEGPQQVVQHPCGQPQQDGLSKGHELVRDRGPHGHPNRRLKKPPRLWPWSS